MATELLNSDVWTKKGIIVIDGGTGTEVDDRGFSINNNPLWSASVLESNPEVIRDVHLDFLRAGAEVIITASYTASVEMYCKVLKMTEEKAREVIKNSVRLAREACEIYMKENPGSPRPLIAGSIGAYGAGRSESVIDGKPLTYTGAYVDTLSKEAMKEFHRPRVECLLSENVDLLAIEAIPAQLEAEVIVDLLKDYPEAKAWVCFNCKSDKHTCHGELFTDAVAAVSKSDQVVGVGVNCTAPELIEKLLLSARDVCNNKPLICYPNSGEVYTKDKYWDAELKRRYRGKKPRLWMATLKLIAPNLILFTLLQLLEMGSLLVQAILVGLLADYFSGDLTAESTRNALLYGAGIVIIAAMLAFTHAHGFFQGQKCGMKARIALTGLIYKKSFTLSMETVGETTIGRIINLASSDVQRIDKGFGFAPFLILSPLYLIAVLLVLWLYLGLGPSSLAGVGTMIALIPALCLGGKLFSSVRLASTKHTDERVKVMNEIISGIRVIKMYGWEYAFKKTIADIRKKEVRLVLLGGVLRVLMMSSFVIPAWGMLPMFTAYTLSTGQPLTPSIVFTSIVLFNSVRNYSISFLVHSLLGTSEIQVALSRIQTLLTKDLDYQDKSDTEKLCGSYSRTAVFEGSFVLSKQNEEDGTAEMNASRLDKGLVSSLSVDKHVGNAQDLSQSISTRYKDPLSVETLPIVSVSNLNAGWRNGKGLHQSNSLTLSDVSFHCDASKRMLAIVGPVGAGKSTILQCLLGELQPLSGTVEVRGSIGYAAQDSWVFSGSVRENVLFGEEFDEDWYSEVLEECCLKEDMSVLPVGDLTLVGERGVTLSGGQKARISLARAMYRKSSVYLLDDPLSAVDAAVGRRLFQICMSGALKNSIVVLVTHHLQYARLADAILVIDKGESLAYGTYDEVVNMINEGESSDCHTRLKTVLSEMDDESGINIDKIEDQFSSNYCKDATADKTEEVTDKESFFDPTSDSISLTALQDAPELLAFVPSEDKAQGSVSIKTYYQYFKAGGGLVGCLIVVFAFCIAEVSLSVSDWFVSEWSELNGTCSTENETNALCQLATSQYILVYFGLTMGSTILSFTRGFLYFYVTTNAAKVLHNQMFAAVLRAPIRFFDTNPIGRVVNRFSKDLHFLDDNLPTEFYIFARWLLRVISFLVVAGVANPYVFIPVAIVVVVFLMVRWYYLTTARQIKRLEAVARSPLFSHITASLQGLTTIRACGRQGACLEYFHAYQDEQTKGWSAYIHGSRWLALRTDFIAAAFAFSVIFLAIPLASSVDAALLGLSITYVLSLTSVCQLLVRASTEVESMMISAERLLSYGDLQSEGPLGTPPGRESPPSSWPHSGDIRLDKLNYRYSSNTPYVLRDITAHIQPTEKIGIIGRTGAGKSSIIQALFRMAEPEGGFEIDGIPITEVGLHQLRQNISIIPQDPVLFSGSVRYNLDPFSQYSDEEIWTALEQVQLKSHMENMEHHLESPVSEGGTNFSVGQRQLMCLGRALLRKNKILVIDEATANVDMTTDAIIQETIRREFSGCTTLTIAHRLHTIMDADRILVLSGGRVVEFDRPHLLLSSPSSLLYGMVEQMGEGEAQRLREIAGEAYAKSRENLMW